MKKKKSPLIPQGITCVIVVIIRRSRRSIINKTNIIGQEAKYIGK